MNLSNLLLEHFRMSWDAFASQWLKTDVNLNQIGVFDKNGNPWGKATVPKQTFEPQPREVKFLVDKCSEDKTEEEKLLLSGVEYMFIARPDDFDGLVTMSKGLDETKMCVVGLTEKACVICTMTGPAKNNCIVTVEKILDNIKQSGN